MFAAQPRGALTGTPTDQLYEELPMMRSTILCLSVASLVGCASASLVRDQAASDLRCPADQLSIELQPEAGKRELFEVSGCEMRATYGCLRTGSMESVCRRYSLRRPPIKRPEQRAREKAAALLECDAAALTIERGRLPGRFNVRGCGRRIRYECTSRSDCCAFTVPGVEPLESERSLPPGRVKKMSPHDVSGQRTKAIIVGADPKVRACFEAGLPSDPGLAGIIELQFLIAPDGQVQTVALASSLGQREVEQCVLEVMRDLRFPAPEGGGIGIVDFPLVFLPNALPESACQ